LAPSVAAVSDNPPATIPAPKAIMSLTKRAVSCSLISKVGARTKGVIARLRLFYLYQGTTLVNLMI
jgi:hypothetical protein